jgi:hypothetical protein
MLVDVLLAALALLGAIMIVCGELIGERRKKLRRSIVIGGGFLAAGIAFIATLLQSRYSARIETLTAETRDLVTGGKSFVWVHAQKHPFTSQDEDLFLITAAQGGDDVPAFDVTVEFEKTGQCDGVLSPNPGRGPRDLRRAYFPAVAPQVPTYPIQTFLHPTCDEAFYLANIYTRNRLLHQQTILRKAGEKWEVFSRLTDAETGALLHAFPNSEAISRQKWAANFPSPEGLRKLRESLRAGEVPQPAE